MLVKDSIIYDTTDVCSKQYICTNAMWLLSVLVFTRRVIIYSYICMYTTYHDRRKIYGINGAKNMYLKQNICMIGTEESNI